MPACVAINCSNRQFKDCGRTFHRFPFGRPDVLKVWVINMRRDKWEPNKTSVLCSDHFTEESFDKTGQLTRLKKYAVPTIFDFPAHLTKRHVSKRKPPKERPFSWEPLPAPVEPPRASASKPTVLATPLRMDDHTYFICESPQVLTQKLHTAVDKIDELKRKLKQSQQLTRRLKKRVSSLENVVVSLQEKQLMSTGGVEYVYSGVSAEFLASDTEQESLENGREFYEYYDS